jgi:hypothetical protein
MSKWMRAAVLVLVPLMASCTDDEEPLVSNDPGDAIAIIRLTIGQTTVDVTSSGASRDVDVPRGATTLAATFINNNGTTVTLPSATTYALDVVSSNTGRLTFTRTGAFTGTLNGVLSGAATISVNLVHGSHSHVGPRTVNVTVLQATDN